MVGGFVFRYDKGLGDWWSRERNVLVLNAECWMLVWNCVRLTVRDVLVEQPVAFGIDTA